MSTSPDKDDMVNYWGCQYVEERNRRGGGGSSVKLDSLVKASVPGFRLESLHASGSFSNTIAMDRATGGNRTLCLIALGSYVGGQDSLLELSSLGALNPKMSIAYVKEPHEASEECKRQTVALPYHVPHKGLDEKELCQHEAACICALHRRLVSAKLNGTPFKALLMELILAGNGGELSEAFLRKLGLLLQRFDVGVVVDEIMTGGRAGPTMAMSTHAPSEFVACVTHITMGKIFGCGIVLESTAFHDVRTRFARGFSTEIGADEACDKWSTISDRLFQGMLTQRREDVMRTCNLPEDCWWGRGLLLFCVKSRPQIQHNLKCRYLPMLENKKVRKMTMKQTAYTKAIVCNMLMEKAQKWIRCAREIDNQQHDNPFVSEFADMIVSKGPNIVTPKQLFDYVGPCKGDELREKAIRNSAERIRKGTQAMVSSALKDVSVKSGGYIKSAKKTKKRRLCYLIT